MTKKIKNSFNDVTPRIGGEARACGWSHEINKVITCDKALESPPSVRKN